MKRAVPIVVLAILTGALLAVVKAQQPSAPGANRPASVYIPSELQLLRLQVKQRDALLAQQEVTRAQAQFQAIMGALNAEADKVKTENGWPKALYFHPGPITFDETPEPGQPLAALPQPAATPPAAAAPAPAAVKPDAKKPPR